MSFVWLRRLLLVLLVQSLSSPVAAHSRSTSYSVWELGGKTVALRVRVAEIDLTRLQLHPDYTTDYATAVQQVLQRDLQLWRAQQPCRYDDHMSLRRSNGQLMIGAQLTCVDSGDYQISSQLLLAPLPTHLHFAQVIFPDDSRRERVLTDDERNWALTIDGASLIAPPSSVPAFWWLGVEHILSGWDHLAFVLGLMLLATSIRQLIWLVTGFTVAHSLTLAATVLGWLQPARHAVEALIALSIVLVSIEVLWQKTGRPALLPWMTVAGICAVALLVPPAVPALALTGMALFTACYFGLLQRADHPHRIRTAIAFGFGLFHGFGFAGVLALMDLSTANLAAALLGFNLGVESGQLLVIVLLWPLLQWLERRKSLVPQFANAAVAGLGMYWFTLRALI